MKMRPLERILVPLDLSPVSDKQVELAASIAKRYRSDMILFHAIDSAILEHVAAGFDPEKIISNMEAEARKKLEAYREKLESEGINAEVYEEIPIADPAIAINEASSRVSASEILLLKKGWHVKRFTLIGGTAVELVKIAKIPILLFHVLYRERESSVEVHGGPDFAKKIVMAVDRNTTENFIDYIKELSTIANTEELIILHVQEHEESEDEANSLGGRVYERLQDAGIHVKRAILQNGKIGRLIIKFAESMGASLAVGRTVKKSLIEWFLGSTLDHIISYSMQPVIIYPIRHISE